MALLVGGLHFEAVNRFKDIRDKLDIQLPAHQVCKNGFFVCEAKQIDTIDVLQNYKQATPVAVHLGSEANLKCIVQRKQFDRNIFTQIKWIDPIK